MNVIAYDPYVSAAKAGQLRVTLVTLDELLAQSDFITVHLPKNKETVGLIGEDALRKVKPSVRIVNAARGGIVDEAAHHRPGRGPGRRRRPGRLRQGPCTDSPLFAFENVVVTPHLGASTDEAQEKAGISVARSVRQALAGDLVPDAVNVDGGLIAEGRSAPGSPGGELGRIFTAVAGSVPLQLDVECHGEITAYGVDIWRLAAMKGLFQDVVEDTVSYVNAPLIAEQRGLEVRLLADLSTQEFRNTTTLRGAVRDGRIRSVSGTLTGPKMVESSSGSTATTWRSRSRTTSRSSRMTTDRPGIIGTFGRILGERAINIGAMQVARSESGDKALVVLTADTEIPTRSVPRSPRPSGRSRSRWSTSEPLADGAATPATVRTDGQAFADQRS